VNVSPKSVSALLDNQEIIVGSLMDTISTQSTSFNGGAVTTQRHQCVDNLTALLYYLTVLNQNFHHCCLARMTQQNE